MTSEDLPRRNKHVVTGAMGFVGRHIAERLLEMGDAVVTLTNRAPGPAHGNRIQAHPLSFEEPGELVKALSGAKVLFNTYWIRYPMGSLTFDGAVANSRILFNAAKAAGVSRVVHVSITNPSKDSPFGYFRGKALVEQALIDSGLSYAILRPAVIFGDEGILINNIAWGLRRMPVFGLFGDGSYRIQPIFVGDLAALAADVAGRCEKMIVDAVGPETFTYRELVKVISEKIQVRRPIVAAPPLFARAIVRSLGKLLGDQMVTHDEMLALMAGLLCTQSPPTGTTRLTDWLSANSSTIGRGYMSEMARRRRYV